MKDQSEAPKMRKMGFITMMKIKKFVSLGLMLTLLLMPQVSWAEKGEESVSPRGWMYLIPVGNILATNMVMWGTARFVLKEDYANINLDTMAHNLRTGFEWDIDGFRVNHIGHPYQGAHYHTGARAIGLNFWAALPFTILGSLKWELLMENTLPAYNDMVFTSLAGPALGEILFRLSRLLIDESTNGLARVGREAMAGLFSPIYGLDRAFSGAARMNGDAPGSEPAELEFGMRAAGVDDQARERRLGTAGLSANLRYGEIGPSESTFRPFDYFTLDLGFDYNHSQRFYAAQLDTTGLLAKWNLPCGQEWECAVGPMVHFDFYESSAYKISSTALGVNLLSEGNLPFGSLKFRGGVELGAMPLGAFDSTYVELGGRDYNFSTGGIVRVNLEIAKPRWFQLRGRTTRYYAHAFDGTEGPDHSAISEVELGIPLSERVGVAVGASSYQREEKPKGFEALTRRVLELQAKLRWRLP